MSGGRTYLYAEHGGFMLHLYARPREFRWGYALRLAGRYVLFGGRR